MQTIAAQRNSRTCSSGVSPRTNVVLKALTESKGQVLQTVSSKSAARNNTKMHSNIKSPNYAKDISMFKILFAAALCATGLYLYMVVSTIVATVERKSLEENVRDQVTELSYQESVYSSLLSSVTLASAREEGYIDANNSGFATRQNSPVLTLNNE